MTLRQNCPMCSGKGQIEDHIQVNDIVIIEDGSTMSPPVHKHMHMGPNLGFKKAKVVAIEGNQLALEPLDAYKLPFNHEFSHIWVFDPSLNTLSKTKRVSEYGFWIPISMVHKDVELIDIEEIRRKATHKKVYMIKRVREITAMGLKDSQILVEDLLAIMES